MQNPYHTDWILLTPCNQHFLCQRPSNTQGQVMMRCSELQELEESNLRTIKIRWTEASISENRWSSLLFLQLHSGTLIGRYATLTGTIIYYPDKGVLDNPSVGWGQSLQTNTSLYEEFLGFFFTRHQIVPNIVEACRSSLNTKLDLQLTLIV